MGQTIVLEKPIKPFSNSAHVILPKCYLGKKASILIRLDDEKTGDDKNDRIRKG